jgi:hypothetical protein
MYSLAGTLNFSAQQTCNVLLLHKQNAMLLCVVLTSRNNPHPQDFDQPAGAHEIYAASQRLREVCSKHLLAEHINYT